MINLGQIHTRRPMIHRSHKPVISSKREGKKTRMEHSRFEVLFSKACCGRRCGLLSSSFAPFFGFSSTLFLHCSFACLCHVRVSLLRFPSLFTLLFSFFRLLCSLIWFLHYAIARSHATYFAHNRETKVPVYVSVLTPLFLHALLCSVFLAVVSGLLSCFLGLVL